jgi:hypothetical protein
LNNQIIAQTTAAATAETLRAKANHLIFVAQIAPARIIRAAD